MILKGVKNLLAIKTTGQIPNCMYIKPHYIPAKERRTMFDSHCTLWNTLYIHCVEGKEQRQEVSVFYITHQNYTCYMYTVFK